MADGTETSGMMKRRGIMAAAAAVLVGMAAKQTAQPVGATTDSIFIASGGDGGTGFLCTTGTYAYGVDVYGTNIGVAGYSGDGGTGTLGNNDGSGFGVSGNADSGTGVLGQTHSGAFSKAVWGRHSTNGYGVYGEATGSGAVGVYGTVTSEGPNGVGAYGIAANNGIGVFGSSVSGSGVYGRGSSGYGVYGVSNSIGVYGNSTQGTGVYGQTSASNQYGILGTTYAANSTAIAGTCTQNGSSAFSGGTANANAYAGVFQGTVVIQGRLIVSDPSYKSGALAHPDGSHRLVYCVESPESWIEDVGKGQLVGGKANVTFDKDFAAVTHTDDYHVFLTPYGDSKGLYVTNKTPGGFEVHEQQGGTSTLGFSWKVMVKGKSSVKSERLGRFTMPNIPLPDPSKFKAPQALAAAVSSKP